MNILQLLNGLSLDIPDFSTLTTDQIIRIEKQILLQKRLQPDLDNSLITNLIEAFKTDAPSLGFVYHHPYFRHIFLKEKYRSLPKSVENQNADAVKLFLQRYFSQDLIAYFNEKYVANQYASIFDLLDYQQFLWEDFRLLIKERIYARVDYAVLNLRELKLQAEAKVGYVSQRVFYEVLTQIKSAETDEKVRELLNETVDLFRETSNLFLGKVMIAMAGYQAIDEEIADVLKQNKEAIFTQLYSTENQNKRSRLSTWQVFWMIMIGLKILAGILECTR